MLHWDIVEDEFLDRAILCHVPVYVFDPVKTKREGKEREGWNCRNQDETTSWCLMLTQGGRCAQGSQGSG